MARRKQTGDPFMEVLREQGDWRTMVDPLAEAVARAFGLEFLARGDGFERKECFDIANALRRSLPSSDSEALVRGLEVIAEYREKGVYLTPRFGFWYIVQRVRELGTGALSTQETALLQQWQSINPNNIREDDNGFGQSSEYGDDEL